jgi:hypothetical protein
MEGERDRDRIPVPVRPIERREEKPREIEPGERIDCPEPREIPRRWKAY